MAAPPHSEFTGGICDCGGCGPCMGAFFCSPCFYGRVAHRLKHFPRSPEETGFSYMNGDCGLYYAINCLTGGFAFVISMMKRTEQREKFGIPGSTLGDCCISCWCTPCALAQAELDLKTRAQATRLIDPNGAPEVYQRQETGMVYQPGQPDIPAMAHEKHQHQQV
ncbi:hypothetical protein C1H76_9461 [Elsinoe australis]|uniref:Uncharacterized protein n=1 Tax=Elsinoe australis TaxID=40998 RepID=A0A4U7AQE3_9PEZI|nr:hypothetical protein C1H76_9461 [Elsinoe australis]